MNPLLPFTLEEYKTNPDRLRHRDGDKPVWSEAVHGNLVAQWADSQYPSLYTVHDFVPCLGLAPKEPKKVLVRLYQIPGGGLKANIYPSGHPFSSTPIFPWISDPIQIPLYEEQK